jgi:hypothetical protein
LTGRATWTIKYRNANDSSGQIFEKRAKSTNDVITVNQRGIYEILDISDDQCPGTVDPLASTFEVDWLPRPQIKLADTAVLIPDGDKYVKREVCEGDIDAVGVNLIGMMAISGDLLKAADIINRDITLPCQIPGPSYAGAWLWFSQQQGIRCRPWPSHNCYGHH